MFPREWYYPGISIILSYQRDDSISESEYIYPTFQPGLIYDDSIAYVALEYGRHAESIGVCMVQACIPNGTESEITRKVLKFVRRIK